MPVREPRISRPVPPADDLDVHADTTLVGIVALVG
jgi:hypothetical protein